MRARLFLAALEHDEKRYASLARHHIQIPNIGDHSGFARVHSE